MDEKPEDHKVEYVDKIDALQGKAVSLALASSNTIVAYGMIVTTRSGSQLPKGCTCVSIDEVVDPTAPLPFPIENVCENVGDALGSHVAWPTNLVTLKGKMPANKKRVEKVKKRMVKCYDSLPSSLKVLYCYGENVLMSGEGILISLEGDLFGHEFQLTIHFEDIIPFCDLEQISGNCIILYLWNLFKKLKEESRIGCQFVDPFLVSHPPKTPVTE